MLCVYVIYICMLMRLWVYTHTHTQVSQLKAGSELPLPLPGGEEEEACHAVRAPGACCGQHGRPAVGTRSGWPLCDAVCACTAAPVRRLRGYGGRSCLSGSGRCIEPIQSARQTFWS